MNGFLNKKSLAEQDFHNAWFLESKIWPSFSFVRHSSHKLQETS